MTDKVPIFIKSTEGVDFDDEESIRAWAEAVHAESLVAIEATERAHEEGSQMEETEDTARPTIKELVDAYDRGEIDYLTLKEQLTGHPTEGLEYENEDPSVAHDTPPLSEDNECWISDSMRLTEEQIRELDTVLAHASE